MLACLAMTPTAIGAHRVWREADLIGLQLAGPLELADVEVLRDLMLLVRREHGHCYMLAHAAGLTGISVAARKSLSEWSRSNPEDRISGVGVHGINFAMRALSALTLGAINVMTRHPILVHFARDEAAARAWIAARRAIDARADPQR